MAEKANMRSSGEVPAVIPLRFAGAKRSRRSLLGLSLSLDDHDVLRIVELIQQRDRLRGDDDLVVGGGAAQERGEHMDGMRMQAEFRFIDAARAEVRMDGPAPSSA